MDLYYIQHNLPLWLTRLSVNFYRKDVLLLGDYFFHNDLKV